MAILLIKDRDRTHGDPIRDRGCYKRGDIVQVFEDDKPVVRPPAEPFYVIKITGGVSRAVGAKWEQEDIRQRVPLVEFGGTETREEMLLRRRHRVELERLSPALIAQLEANRYLELTWAQARRLIRDKVTGRTE